MNQTSETEKICCPKYDAVNWDDKTLEWQKKQFVKASVFTLFNVPVNFGGAMRKLDKKFREAGAIMTDNLCLAHHTSKWNMDIYLGVDKEVAGTENVELSGKFYSKVYEGPFSDTGKWCKDYEGVVKSKGLEIKKWYMWYTTCPKCAKKYGKNYVAIMAQVE
jgi:hypothetical protein